AKVFFGHSDKHIIPDMTVIYNSDIKNENPEYQAARKYQCRLLHRSDLLIEIMSASKAITIAGTHGKTTTSALVTAILMKAGLDPSYAVGGIMKGLDAHAQEGKGEFFVAEADESDGTFLKYSPWASIVTNIDNDHLDYYKSEEGLNQAFQMFLNKVPEERLIYCGDDPRLLKLSPKGISYGFNDNAELHISRFRQEGWTTYFDLCFKGKTYQDISLKLVGRHNVLNAAAAFGLGLILGIKEKEIRVALEQFEGVKRRCDKKEEVSNVLVLDDYAHHPNEVKATLQGIREAIQERRMIVFFQPHRYTRTKECLGQYGSIFDDADEVIITDIYAAQELPIPGIHAESILKEVESTSLIPCRYSALHELKKSLSDIVRPHDVIVCLGAGDITKFAAAIPEMLKVTPPKKYRVGLFFGGKSAEHEVSLASARYIESCLSKEKYEVVRFGITKSGQWLADLPAIQTMLSTEKNDSLSQDMMEKLNSCDLFFPVLHGPNGEDGTIQGFFDILGKPYIGCDHRSAAICMDKAITKRAMILHGIPTSPFIDFSRHSWKRNGEEILKQIRTNLRFPLFVKPTHLGSSIGITKVITDEELIPSIEFAFRKDTHILVENGLVVREIEFAVFGNHWITAFPPGEVLTNGEVYNYQMKYGENASETLYQVDLPEDILLEGIFLAKEAYKVVGCTGMARVDFFLDPQGKFWLNEINPIPGFTQNSLFPKICDINGLKGSGLIDRLIVLALERKRDVGRIELK
ncbi:MAG TPA: UDP-N-acetylmuramate--L-alanine ligase, partial [Waddliaceae bacterium]